MKIYYLTTEIVQIINCCCLEMFIGRQIAIQRGLDNFNRKIPKSKEKAG